MKVIFCTLFVAALGMSVKAAQNSDFYSLICKMKKLPEEFPYVCFDSLDGPVQKVGYTAGGVRRHDNPANCSRESLFAYRILL